MLDKQTVEQSMPIVHLNGTSLKELMKQREDVYDALYSAVDVMRAMGPNGRDYYPETGRMEKALDTHQRRMRAIQGVMEELEHELAELGRGATEEVNRA